MSASEAPYTPPDDPRRVLRRAVAREDLEPLLHPGRHHPFQLWILGACALSGIGLLLDEPAPDTVERLLPPPLVVTWALVLGICGAVGIMSALWRDAGTALLLERAALLPLGTMFLVYATAIFVLAPEAATRGRLILALGIAALWRGSQVHRKIRALQKFGRADDP